MILKPTEALEIMRQHDCEMTLSSLYAWLRSKNSPCPFGVYTQSDESNNRGTYTIWKGRLLMWLEGRDMRVAYGGYYVDQQAASVFKENPTLNMQEANPT